MDDSPTPPTASQPIPFKAETRQLLEILIHSLYTEREIFLRELISNGSDALTRLDFEVLTNREVVDPSAELAIQVLPDPEQNTLTIRDTGIGMTAAELTENLGTIAHSGVREFVAAAKAGEKNLSDLIGQFGVGFYSVFMVAESVRVVSRSYRPEASPAAWSSTGGETFTVEPAEKTGRGTDVIIQLKADASEFAQESRLREIIQKHSDFIPYPIYLADQKEQANQQTALWRQQPRQVEKQAYEEFYKQLTLDIEPPLAHAHMVVDAPVQMYALLFVPASPERNLFSPRKEDGLKLYARKVLIQEYSLELLPEYLRFVQGVVDSEDIPLNVSRESVQSNRVMGQLKKLLTSKILDTLKQLAQDDPGAYNRFWEAYDRYIKQGIAIEPAEPVDLYPLLRFPTTAKPDEWSSLDDYIARMQTDQKAIYYLLGDDKNAALHSPHLEALRRQNYEVLLLTDPLDPFTLVRLKEYQGKPLANAASAELELPQTEAEAGGEAAPAGAPQDFSGLISRIKDVLGDKVADVRTSSRLVDSPARLVDPQGAPQQEIQRVYRLMNKDFEAPKKVLEINPRHPILLQLNVLRSDQPLAEVVIEQIYEDALLIEGLHPDPSGMVARIQKLMEAALGTS